MTSLDILIVTGCAMLALAVLLYVGLLFGPVDWVLPSRPKAPPRTALREPATWNAAAFAEDREQLRRDRARLQANRQRIVAERVAAFDARMKAHAARLREQQRAFDQRNKDYEARVAAYRRPQPAEIADVWGSLPERLRHLVEEGAQYEPPPVTKPALTPAELELKEAFRIVGLSETATEEQIRAHRKSQLGHFHPDKHPEGKERRRAEQRFIAYNAGFQTIFKHKGWA